MKYAKFGIINQHMNATCHTQSLEITFTLALKVVNAPNIGRPTKTQHM
jgi:hypothetical protein